MPFGPSPDSPLRTGHAPFSASGSPSVGPSPSSAYGQAELPLHFAAIHEDFTPRWTPTASVSVTFAPEGPTDCRPSPWGRLSRPRTTTAAPTLPWFHRRILASVSGEPLTFMVEDAAKAFRRRLPIQPKPLFAESRDANRVGQVYLSGGSSRYSVVPALRSRATGGIPRPRLAAPRSAVSYIGS